MSHRGQASGSLIALVVSFVAGAAGCGSSGGGTPGGTCTPNARVVCRADRLVWEDSCGVPGGFVQACPCGCAADGVDCRADCADAGPACEPHAARRCVAAENAVYWFDSCDAQEDADAACPCGCEDGAAECTECPTCQPLCAGRCCGDDQCEGTCPDTCARPQETCDLATCTCEACAPTPCAVQGYQCGEWDDGCGRVRLCGDCVPPQVCAADGVCRDEGDPGCPTGRTACPDGCVDLREDPSNCGECERACEPGEACVSADCQLVPTSCPCPAGMYCDLSSNLCIAGCLDDSDCAGGSICVTRHCQAGCREDEECGGGQICNDLTCREGCREDGDCGTDRICESLTCREGCREDEDCGADRICADLLCTTGCRADAECGAGRICADDVCRAGCRQDAQCPSGLVCDDATLTCRCLSDDDCGPGRVCEDDACREGCHYGRQCYPVGGDFCGDDLTCEEWGDGGRCYTDDLCGGWLEYCDLSTLRCVWSLFVRSRGALCNPDDGSPCASDDVCSPVTLRCESASCSSGTCADGLVCADGVCSQPSSCRQGGCPSGMTCVDDVCIVGPESCTADSQCGSDLYLCAGDLHRCLPYWRILCEADHEGCWSPVLRCDPLMDSCVPR